MINDKSLVSIIIPSYNRADVIIETISSVQNQTYPKWEALIIDDGSSDSTEQVVSALAINEPRVKFLKRTRLPKGAPTCRNIGWSVSKGDYVIFLDSDDILAPYCLEQRVKYMEENPDLDFAVFPMLVFNEKPGDSFVLWNAPTDVNDLDRFLSFDAPWQTTCPIWKPKALHKIGGWDEDALTWQDWEIHVKSLANQLDYKKADLLPDCFLRRDEKEGRISSGDNADNRFLSRLKTFNNIYQIISEKHLLTSKIEDLFARLYFINAEKAALLGKSAVVTSFFEAIGSKGLAKGVMVPYVKLLLIISQSKIPFVLSAIYKFMRTMLPTPLTQIQTTLFKRTLGPEGKKQVQKLLKDQWS